MSRHNSDLYRTYTLRIPRTESDMIAHLDGMPNINQYLTGLVHADMCSPSPVQGRYELIDMQSGYDVVAAYDTTGDAYRACREYHRRHDADLYIVQRFTGILQDGTRVQAGKIINSNRQEGIKNAE